ncbi:MAG: hypothetical protein IJP92_15265, partial [Lachnospiraceae bacterium]|nr:hypothetical protein [Lachnospiraceae bacterium]
MANKRLKKTILEVVENQLEENDPPFIHEIYDRLNLLSGSSKEAREMIGSVVAMEIFDIMSDGKAFDEEQYYKKLLALFDRFDPEDVEIAEQLAIHPFCRMHLEYEDLEWSGKTDQAAAVFLSHWNKGLKEWLRTFAQKPDGRKKRFAPEELNEEDNLISGYEIFGFFQDIDLALRNAGFHRERLELSRVIQESFSWEGLYDSWSEFHENEGEALNDTGDYSGCDRLFEDWLKDNPDSITCVNGYLLCLLDRKGKSFFRAKELIETYMPPDKEVDSENDLLLERAIELYEALGDSRMLRIYKDKNEAHRARSADRRYDFDGGDGFFQKPFI